jgi:cytochrome c biogenesis protein CcmG/thiol:disulfide interchange protein DsbE
MVKRSLWPLIIFIGLAIFFSIGLMLNPRNVPSPLIGQPAPKLVGLDLLTDQPMDHAFQHQQVYFLNIWASWCVACRQEHPELVKLAQQGVSILGLNYKDNAHEARAWLAEHQNPYQQILSDPVGQNGLNWGVIAIPETFLIDSQGIVRAKWTGALTAERIQNEVLPAWQKWREQL